VSLVAKKVGIPEVVAGSGMVNETPKIDWVPIAMLEAVIITSVRLTVGGVAVVGVGYGG
jgi:hypothetical protein